MTDDSPPLVPLSLTNEKNSSSWNFDDLNNEDESDQCNDFFSVLKKNVAKHVYADEEIDNNNKCLSNKTTQRSTTHIDSSDLISRCKHFLPLLTDENRKLFSKINSGENVRIELDSDQDNDERAIEMDLMFCPNVDSSSESDSDDDDDDQQSKTTSLQFIKKINQVNIVEIPSSNILQDNKSEEIVKN